MSPPDCVDGRRRCRKIRISELFCRPWLHTTTFSYRRVKLRHSPRRGPGDAVNPFDPATSFIARLQRDLTARGFVVWFGRVAMSTRGLTFRQEIQDAVAARERWVLVVGPKAAVSDYVRQEWLLALQADKAVTPILRQGDYPIVPDELRLFHNEDFHDDGMDGAARSRQSQFNIVAGF